MVMQFLQALLMGKKGKKSDVLDFMPQWDQEEEQESSQSVEDMKTILMFVAASQGCEKGNGLRYPVHPYGD